MGVAAGRAGWPVPRPAGEAARRSAHNIQRRSPPSSPPSSGPGADSQPRVLKSAQAILESSKMSGEDSLLPSLQGQASTIAHALMEEDLQRELDRNAAATKMALAHEVEAQAAKKRAEASQQKMSEMMAKYEAMKAKLDATKGSLDEKRQQITNQAALTEKITAMKERVEQYAAKKEAVSALSEHVAIRQVLQQNKLDVVNEELDQEDDNTANAARLGQVKTGLKEHTERMQILQRNMQKNAETMAKREQNKIAAAREKLLEMKMRELELQKAKMERTKREQEERKRATNDFMAGVEAELEEMEAKAKAPLLAEREKQLGAVPKQGKKGKGKKSKGNTPKVMSPEPKTPKVMSPEPKTPKVMSPEPAEKE